ncbi:MAG: hypothetical protein M5U01_42505 [Ardenticatenaceae bacterium]|nr:hypothetical protein [Ardenticatenaceae bacterium]
MKAQEFRDRLPDHLRPRLPPEWRAFRTASRFSYVQFWYGPQAFHFEASPYYEREIYEVGLHFESRDKALNATLHAAFDRRFAEIRHSLGADVFLEQWDRGWHKLYRCLPFPARRYDDGLLDAVVSELARQIALLQPMLDEALAAPGE